ncbi:hypothetical protein CBOM_06331 [Ceraceosorus bombacis]|uniref:Uncharacterized protein n=1 Tax=Ceraceosorus bombacis TaxID=401625 RepID=A0A0N7LBG0_9BASI|nr:hypothetical protein CBOM_06331 [Ceraceosorus bombacis]
MLEHASRNLVTSLGSFDGQEHASRNLQNLKKKWDLPGGTSTGDPEGQADDDTD